MNIIIGIILIIICTYIGFIVSKKYSEKVDFYSSFQNFNNKLKNEVSFTQRTIKSIISTTNKKDCFYNQLVSFFIDKNFDLEKIKCNYLSNGELIFIKSYFENIGLGDRNSELKYLNSISTEIEEKYLVAKKEHQKYKSLYIKIGFLIGLMFLILFL